jgi:Asp-tRNA(Asn)/Glu-tRNA(Gln) amidotransferase A subunit family amidase
MTMSELWFKPAYELAAAIRARQLSPLELMEACLQRIEQVNPIVNAFIAMRPEEALAEALAAAERIAGGEEGGLLAGLPFGVKELEDAAGFPSTHASVPFKDNWPERDSVQVERLKKAGGILLGKTNSPEFGYTAFTKNLLFGITRNPWNPERTPGGSSGGTSAAIASGMVPLATGSDGGGSIRIPACYTGCFGLKPTFGRVAKGPFRMLNWSDTSCYGPITRTVRDGAMYMDAVVGHHPADPDSLPHPGISYVETLEQLPRNLRIAWSPTLGYARLQSDVQREVEQAVRVFEKLGHNIEELEGGFPDPGLEWVRVAGAETYAEIYDQIDGHREEFGRAFLRGTEAVRNLTPEKYGAAQRTRAELVNYLWHLFERYDLLMTPTLPTDAFDARGRWPTQIDGERVTNPMHIIAFTYPFNLSRHPAATVRAGLTDAGLPCGLQIVGPYHREELVLQASYAYEQERPWNDVWPREVPTTV